MENVNIGSGNISKKIGYSITDKQLEKISAKAVEILDTVSGNKADRNLSNVLNEDFKAKAEAAGVGEKEYTEISASELDEIILKDNNPKLYKVTQDGIMFVTGFVPYFVYAGETIPSADGMPTQLYQYKTLSDGIYLRTGTRGVGMPGYPSENTWSEWQDVCNSGADNIFVIHATLTSEKTATTEESYDEIKEAITAEKQILIAVGGDLFTVTTCSYDRRDSFATAIYENEYCVYNAKIKSDGTIIFSTTRKVLSVNGQTGEVNLTASDVGAVEEFVIPAKEDDHFGNITIYTTYEEVKNAIQQKKRIVIRSEKYEITPNFKIDEFQISVMFYWYGVKYYNYILVPDMGVLGGQEYVIETIDNLTTASIRDPLSANQGKILNETKADKPTYIMPNTETLILTHNQEAHFEEITALTLSMPETIDNLYWSSFCFTSPEIDAATSIIYPAEPIIWVGDDCDADGIFVPEVNTRYEVNIKRLGDDIVARVGAY